MFRYLVQLFFLMNVCLSGLCQEKGNSPIHVAAQAGQNVQVELLAVYGADPGAKDANGRTPYDYAK